MHFAHLLFTLPWGQVVHFEQLSFRLPWGHGGALHAVVLLLPCGYRLCVLPIVPLRPPPRAELCDHPREEWGRPLKKSWLFVVSSNILFVVPTIPGTTRKPPSPPAVRGTPTCVDVAMLDLAFGVALYAAPPHIKFPGLLGVGVLRALIRKAKAKGNASLDEQSNGTDSPTGVELRWDNITSTLGGKNAKKAKKNKGKAGDSSDASSDASERVILQNVSGHARPGRLLAILGPSGSGKTSLLNVLAAQTPADAKLQLTGRLTRNGIVVGDGKAAMSKQSDTEGDVKTQQQISSNAHRKKVAYVRQQDVFYSELSVRETLTLSAKMRTGGVQRIGGDIDDSVTSTLRSVGLLDCADARVGDQKKRGGGISGGERKRLALACELVGDSPSVVCTDEPTSGLDAFQAQRVVASLKKLCTEGNKTVIASIHQPRGSIVSLFDDVCVLASGKVMYCGPLELVPKWFASKGYSMPNNVNPAEFLIDLASVDASDVESEMKSKERVDELCSAWQTEGVAFIKTKENGLIAKFANSEFSPFKAMSKRSSGEALRLKDVDELQTKKTSKRPGFLTQLKLLTTRSWRQVTRDKKTNKVRLITSLNSALVFGSIFWKMGFKQSSVQDRLGLLQVSAINAAMAALMKTISAFTSEKIIVDRERSSGNYETLPYLVGKLIAELPAGAFFPLCFGAVVYPMCGLNTNGTLGDKFLKFAATIVVESFASSAMGLCVSAIAPSTEAAVAMGPAVMVMFIVFGGYYVNAENVPYVFRWIPDCSLIKHSFQGLCVNEFHGLDFESELRGDTKHGEEVLERLGFGDSSVEMCLKKQANVLGFCYLSTLYVLEKNAPKFQRIENVAISAAVVENEDDEEVDEVTESAETKEDEKIDDVDETDWSAGLRLGAKKT